MCDKLEIKDFILTQQEFLIKNKNPLYCADWSQYCSTYIPPGPYFIHYDPTARYRTGDMQEQMAQEFKQKWY